MTRTGDRMLIAVLPGDGIGREVVAQAVRVLRAAVGERAGLELVEASIGVEALERYGDPLPQATLDLARKADAILFGSAGVPGDEKLPY
jgi:3-isopropylmalate dehydrogenase